MLRIHLLQQVLVIDGQFGDHGVIHIVLSSNRGNPTC
jgi:hypothetical protein